MPLLEVNNLTKKYDGLLAVDNVSFKINAGQIFALIGPNGSGKTTIFNCINNFCPITSGNIIFKNNNIENLKSYKICKMGIGRTFQVVKPLSRMTVLDNIVTSAFLRVNNIENAREKALEILDFCGLSHLQDKQAKSLPIAGKKRLEIARALATEPSLLLLDETAAGLNPKELEEAIALIKKIKEKGISILIVEHIMKVIMAISDLIHVINFGKTIFEGKPEDAVKNRAVIEAYLGEEYANS